MTVGKVIRRCRKIKGMTLDKLGRAIGFSGKSANVRISQYETSRALPTGKSKTQLAAALGISEYALSAPSLKSDIEIMHTLFNLDSTHEIYVGKYKERIFMFLEPSDEKLKAMFSRWHEKQNEYKQGKITPEEYDLWKYGFEDTADVVSDTNA